MLFKSIVAKQGCPVGTLDNPSDAEEPEFSSVIGSRGCPPYAACPPLAFVAKTLLHNRNESLWLCCHFAVIARQDCLQSLYLSYSEKPVRHEEIGQGFSQIRTSVQKEIGRINASRQIGLGCSSPRAESSLPALPLMGMGAARRWDVREATQPRMAYLL